MLRIIFHDVSVDADEIHRRIAQNSTRLKILIILGILSAFSAILQSAGGFFSGPGFAISPLATLPMILAMIISPRNGMLSYLIAISLLIFIQPSEVIIFTFTTGLLGVSIGSAFHSLKVRFKIVLFGGLALTAGIAVILYGFGFPLLGPGVSSSFQLLPLMMIALFSSIYSWIWVEGTVLVLKIMRRIT